MRALFNRSAARRLVMLLLTGGVAVLASAANSVFNSTAALSNVSGENIYSHICQGCHMPHAEGAIGAGHYPKLAGDPALTSWEFVALTVLGGRNDMPAFGASADLVWDGPTVHLSDAQVADVVNYVRSHFGNKYRDKVTAAQVAKLPHPTTAAAP
jgi:mono/diheme cytochrome c family protein